jgi:hypothetical protein
MRPTNWMLLRLEKIEPSEKALRESLQYDRSFSQSHYHLGRVLEKQGARGGGD